MNNSINMIDLAKFNGPVYSGRPRGELLREELNLNQIDASGQEIEVKIPDDTYTISSSFFLGLFGPSVVRAGTKSAFYKQYHFKTPEFLRATMDDYVDRALQKRSLFG